MSEPKPLAVPTWIGEYAVRIACVFLGLFVILLIMDLFGFGKLNNPFHDWEDWWQVVGIGVGISLMLGLEFLVERMGWVVKEPKKRDDMKPPGTD